MPPRFELLDLFKHQDIVRITLNRPEVHNAFNDQLVQELTDCFKELGKDDGVRVIILTGAGESFCAGADLNWMKSMIEYSKEDNIKDAKKMLAMFKAIDQCPKPVIGRINGSAFGGGVGLVACCDIAIAAEEAQFGFTEVNLGLIPAVISPFVVKKIGQSAAREYFLTGERFPAPRAKWIGLVRDIAPLKQLDSTIAFKLKMLRSSGPKAIDEAKILLEKCHAQTGARLEKYTAEKIAALRASDEGQEGMNAFLEKRKPNWR